MNKNKLLDNRLVIVTGVSGDLGRAYFKHYSGQSNTRCIGISRKPICHEDHIVADLLDKNALSNSINAINMENIEEILLINPVGKFKFEDQDTPMSDINGDGIDDEVYDSNVKTFVNIFRPLYKKSFDKKIRIVQFGSVSDKKEYSISMWKSYSQSKNILRYMTRKLTNKKNIDALFINLSSVLTGNESKTRPYADTTYWITPEEIVDRSIATIESTTGYSELSLFKPNPKYHNNYFHDHEAIYSKWKKEMGT